jgi:hypothetical protein
VITTAITPASFGNFNGIVYIHGHQCWS